MLLIVVVDIVNCFILVVKSFFFVKICVRIGKVVMDIVIFMNMRNGLKVFFGVIVRCRMKEILIFVMKGRVILVVVMDIVCFLVF